MGTCITKIDQPKLKLNKEQNDKQGRIRITRRASLQNRYFES